MPLSDADSLKFLARYLKKAPVSNQRLEFLEDLNTVRYIKYTDSGKEHKDFDPLHFLAEVSQHIPNKWEQTIRYMGIYSARTRGAARNAFADTTHAVNAFPRPMRLQRTFYCFSKLSKNTISLFRSCLVFLL